MVQGTHHRRDQTHHRFGLPSETPGQPLVARQIDKAIEIARGGAGEATCHMASKMKTCRHVVFWLIHHGWLYGCFDSYKKGKTHWRWSSLTKQLCHAICQSWYVRSPHFFINSFVVQTFCKLTNQTTTSNSLTVNMMMKQPSLLNKKPQSIFGIISKVQDVLHFWVSS